jgi:hypothetical protein
MKLTEGTDDQLMAMAAMRYCLGRSSYIVGSCVDWIYATWPQFTRNTQLTMIRDTVEALQMQIAGSQTVDAPRWRAMCEWAWRRIDDDGRDWIKAETRWRGPLPFDTGESKAV